MTAWRAGQGLKQLERELAQDPDLTALRTADSRVSSWNPKARQVGDGTLSANTGAASDIQWQSQADAGAAVGRECTTSWHRFTAAELKTRRHSRPACGHLRTSPAIEPATVRSDGAIGSDRKRLSQCADRRREQPLGDASFGTALHCPWSMGELIHLYEQMGLTATDTPFAVHISSDRARLPANSMATGGDAEATRTTRWKTITVWRCTAIGRSARRCGFA